MAPDTKPNLTKPNLSVAPAFAGDDQEEDITLETDEEYKPNGFRRKPADQNSLLVMKWAEARTGAKFPNPKKQLGTIAIMFRAGYTADQIKAKWEQLETDEYWSEKGVDFGIVLSQIARKKADAPTFKSYAKKKHV